MVETAAPSAMTASVREAFARLPPTSTVHARARTGLATFVGAGKAEMLAHRIEQRGVDLDVHVTALAVHMKSNAPVFSMSDAPGEIFRAAPQSSTLCRQPHASTG